MATSRGSVWMVPRRPDPGFVGRGKELAALEAALAASGPSAQTQAATLHGLGGTGKTVLAVQFADRHAADYDAVLWLAAEEPTALASSFAELARELRLPEAAEPDQGVRTAAVLGWLGANDRWLLVFDNARGRADVEPYLPRRLIGHVLITSQNPDWPPLARLVKVRPLPRPDSVALLLSGHGPGHEAEADLLADALGDLPLALAQAAAYVRETACSFTEYRQRFLTEHAAFDLEQTAEAGYGRTVAATLELALGAIRHGDGQSPGPGEALLTRCAFYAPDRIPRELLAADCPDVKTLNDAIRELRRYSLVDTEAGAVSVHRLVQRAVQLRMPPEERAAYAGHAVEVIVRPFPDQPHDVRTWPECDKFLSHAIHAAEIAEGLGVSAGLIAPMLGLVGVHLWAKSDLRRARVLLLRALGLMEAAYGPDHPEVASTLGNLGIVARDQGDLAEARRCQERALRIEEAAYGPDHPEVASTLGNLGLVARDQGNLAEARRCQERALRIKEAAYGPDHPEVARTLGNLGLVARDQGDLAEARRCQERALRIEEAAYGPDHPEVARTLGNLGLVARDQGDLAEARRCQERAVRTFRKLLGDEHPNTITALNNLRSLDEPPPETTPVPENTAGGTRIKVLFLAANPAGTTPLALDDEIRAIDAKIRGSEQRDRLQMVSHWAVRLDDLSGLLMRQRPDVVHFSGHGEAAGDIVLVGADGAPKPVPTEALAGLFRVLKDNVRVVVFNACHSEAQARGVVKVIDCAVGTSREIDDDHAIAFAAEFYQALGYGKSVQDAYDLGVIRLVGEGVADARKLVKLYKRKGVDPAAVVLLGAGAGASQSPTDPQTASQPAPTAAVPRPPIDDQIRAVLRPLMADVASRKARLSRAFAAYPGLLDRIDTHGEAGVFLSHLIQTLRDYGEVETGRPALAVLLESIRGEVGAGDNQRIDQILRAVRGELTGA